MPNSSGSNIALRKLMKSSLLLESLGIGKSSLMSKLAKVEVKKEGAEGEIAIQMSRLRKKSLPEDLLFEIAKGLHDSVLAIMKAEELLEKISGDLEKLSEQMEKVEEDLKGTRGWFDRCTILSVSTKEEVQWLVRHGVFRTLQVWGGLEDEEKVGLMRYAKSRGFNVKQI